MTPLARRVRRKVDAPRRPLVVTLTPDPLGAFLELREAGRRAGFSITLAGLYVLLAKRAADNAIAERQARRRAAKKGGAR